MELPLVGLGTWRLTGEECTRVVEMGLELGYRHIDTAHSYDNHEAIAYSPAPSAIFRDIESAARCN